MNNPLRGKVDKLLTTKKSSSYGSVIVYFFVTRDPFQKDYMWPKTFLEDMGLLIIKNHLSMQFVESLRMKHLCLHLCQRLVFPSKK